MKQLNLVGKKFNKLTVLKYSHNNKHRVSYWKCKCDCGKYSIVRGSNLKSGKTKSCGCLKKKSFIKHGLRYHKHYKLYMGILERCYNKKCNYYEHYGARNIKMHKEWKTNMRLFFDYIENTLGDKPGKQFTLDRINNNGNYEPGNLRWASKQEQAYNTRRTVYVTYKTIKFPLHILTKVYNINHKLVWTRIFKQGWNIERALKTK